MKEPNIDRPRRGMTKYKKVTISPKEIVYNDAYIRQCRKRLNNGSGDREVTTQHHTGILKTNKNNFPHQKPEHHDESIENASQDAYYFENNLEERSTTSICDINKEQISVNNEKESSQDHNLFYEKDYKFNRRKPPMINPHRRHGVSYASSGKTSREQLMTNPSESPFIAASPSQERSSSFHERLGSQNTQQSISLQKLEPNSQLSGFSSTNPTEEALQDNQMQQEEQQDLVAPPPPGYFIRDDISTEEELTATVCCNKHGEKIADDVPLCTFGYQSWSQTPYCCDLSPDCDSNASPRSDMLSPYSTKKRNAALAKKTKKTKRRKRTKSMDNSDKRIAVERNPGSKEKPDVSLKKGVAMKQGPKKENAQLQRYKQRVLNPRNPKLFQIMGTLPVSMDSILYYYEPHGKAGMGKVKTRKTVGVNKGARKMLKNKDGSRLGNTVVNGRVKKSCRNNSKQDDILYLNTNGNANNSDIDLSELKSPNSTPAQSCTRQNGATHLPAQTNDAEQGSTVGDLLPGDYSSVYYDEFDLSAKTTSELGKTNETKNGPYNIDTVVDDFIQNAFKEETEYEQTLTPEKLESTPRQNDEHAEALGSMVKNGSLATMPAKCNKIVSKKAAVTDKEKCKMQERSKILSKVTYPKSDAAISPRQMRKKSLSTPNISVGRSEQEREDNLTSDSDNVYPSPMSSLLQAQKEKSDAENMLCKSQTSPQLAYISADAVQIIDATTESSQEKIATIQIDESATTAPSAEDECVDKLGQRERGRLKKSQKTGSILRKPNTSSLEDKRTHNQHQKSQAKTKPAICFTKSHSLSPVYKKKSSTQSTSSQSTKKSKDTSDVPKKTGKKTKKKVRIVVDVNGIQPDKVTADEDAKSYLFDLKDNTHSQQENYDDEEIEDNHAFLDGLIEKCKSENETAQQNNEALQEEQIAEAANEEEEKEHGDLGFCGFSETNSDQESLPSSPKIKEVTATVHKTKKVKKSHKHIDKENKEKAHVVEKERIQAERGWDNNFIVQKEDSKTKVMLKKKRYQLKKANDMDKFRSEVDDIGYLEKQKSSSEVDAIVKKGTTNKFQKPSAAVKKRGVSPKMSKKNLDPIQLKQQTYQDPREGSSVDAPGFNKKELGVRATKSGPTVSLSKQTTKENLVNQGMSNPTNRVKMARDNFSKISRKRSPSPTGERGAVSSIVDQVSPMASRSTDLDLAFSCRRQQLSPGRAAAVGRLARRDSKVGHGSKFRSKSESEDYKQKAESSSCGKGGSGRLQHADPMDMNVLNLGLSWMIQGLIKRFSIFNKKSEGEEEMSSPVTERDFESAQQI